MIRVATINDLSELKNLESSCFDEHIRENFEFVLNSENHIIMVYQIDEKIIAYAGASISYEQGDILSICVYKNYRKQGIAFNLLTKLIEFVRKKGVKSFFLEVEEDNIPAISLYQKIGFKEISRRKNYYGKKSAIIMMKEL